MMALMVDYCSRQAPIGLHQMHRFISFSWFIFNNGRIDPGPRA
jgi:hypothetical protein